MRLYSQIFIPTSFATRISSLIPVNHIFAICSWNGLICRSCGAVIDLPMEPLSDIDQKAQACFYFPGYSAAIKNTARTVLVKAENHGFYQYRSG